MKSHTNPGFLADKGAIFAANQRYQLSQPNDVKKTCQLRLWHIRIFGAIYTKYVVGT